MRYLNKIIIFIIMLFILVETSSEAVFLTNNKVKIIGHRGASGLAPENTIVAYEKAAEIGMWGIEGDLYVIKDGNMVMFHDETVDRMTNGIGKIVDMTLEEVKALTIDSGNYIDKYKNLKIPTFDEYLDCCRKNNLVPVIEFKQIKVESVEEIIKKIKLYELEDIAIIISTNIDWIRYIREFSDKIYFQYLADINTENLSMLNKYNNCGIDIKAKNLNKKKIELAHNNNCKVNVWTINDRSISRKLFDLGIDMITSDILGNDL